LLVLAQIHQQRSDPRAADRDSRQALALARRMSNSRLVAETLLCRVLVHHSAGEHRAAARCLAEALQIARAGSLRLLEGRALTAAATTALANGDLTGAVCDGEQALAIHRETGHRPGAAATHALLGRASRLAGDTAAAAEHDQQARALSAWMGLPRDPGFAPVPTGL